VILDGTLVNACCIFGVETNGGHITTIEGLSNGNELHPLQQTFLEGTGMQCGFCTPGFLIAASALLDENSEPTEEEIRHWLVGNLCRCTGYDKIVKAVQDAALILRERAL
jgi:carbon-monoxide dehydrogenase small subunit